MEYEEKMNKKIISIWTIVLMIVVVCMNGCAEKTPKGMSSEMYGYVKEATTTTHRFLDGEITRSDTKGLTDTAEKIADLVKKESADGILDEKYYNDKEAGQLALQMMLYLYSEDGIDEVENALEELDIMLANK